MSHALARAVGVLTPAAVLCAALAPALGLPRWAGALAFSAAAALLAYRRAGGEGVGALLGRTLDARRISSPVWYLPALLLNPAVAAAVYRWQRLRGVPVPPFETTAAEAGGLVLLFLLAAAGEEVGWSGYALDPLLRRWGSLGAGLALGARLLRNGETA
ncbi:MAG: hypothetical protein ABTQ28_11060, partial [Thauera sp.]